MPVNATSTDSIIDWIGSGCVDALTLWPEHCMMYPGHESIVPDMIPADYYFDLTATIRAVSLYRFCGMTFSSDGSFQRRGQKFKFGNLMPSYADVTTDDPKVLASFCGESADDIDSAFIWLHNPSGTYGHFLLEMAPKLSSYRRLRLALPDLPILLGWYTPQYIKTWIELICPGAPIVCMTQNKNVTVKRAYYSDMLMDEFCLGEAFRAFLADIRVHGGASGANGEKLFISRRTRRTVAKDFRIWDNEEVVGEALVGRGFRVITPEVLSIPDQIAEFRQASVVVGELSSALHNVIFSSSSTLVVQINPFSAVQRRICMSLGQSLISLIPDSGLMCGWPAGSVTSFTVHPDRVLEAIK